MAAIHLPAALQTNASVAGLTGTPAPPTGSPITAAERFAETVRTEAGGLGYLFGHTAAQAVETPLEEATNAVRGRLGGLVPATSTNVTTQDAPTRTAPLRGITTAVRTQLSNDVASLRKALGI